jgi:Xaa-Pro aminopeptidase
MDNRITYLRKILEERKIDAILVSNFYNVFYLTDFKTLSENEREAFVVVTKKNVHLITDGRYFNSKKRNGGIYDTLIISPDKKLIQHLQDIIKEEKIKSLVFEAEDIKFNEYESLKEKLNVDLIPATQLVIKLREIKEPGEIEKIKKACKIGDRCLKDIAKQIRLGTTEKEIIFKIEFWLKEKGYGSAFAPIVAIDENSAIPHYDNQTGNGHVKRDSLILIDMGVKHENYCSDITRMFVFGKPSTEIINVYEKLLDIQEKTIKHISSIKELKDADSFARSLISNFQLPNFPHSLGHGIGLEVHEYPKLSMYSEDLLQPRQVFTVEPGVYFPGKWGMRIEDSVTVGNNLNLKLLTKFPKELKIIK